MEKNFYKKKRISMVLTSIMFITLILLIASGHFKDLMALVYYTIWALTVICIFLPIFFIVYMIGWPLHRFNPYLLSNIRVVALLMLPILYIQIEYFLMLQVFDIWAQDNLQYMNWMGYEEVSWRYTTPKEPGVIKYSPLGMLREGDSFSRLLFSVIDLAFLSVYASLTWAVARVTDHSVRKKVYNELSGRAKQFIAPPCDDPFDNF